MRDLRAEVEDAAFVEAIGNDWRAADMDERGQALCAYAEKLTRTPAKMTAGDLAPLREHGLSDTDILDLVQIIGYFNYINRVADALGVPKESD